MTLSDDTVMEELEARRLVIRPFELRRLQPASYDMTLGPVLRFYDPHDHSVIDPHKRDELSTTAYDITEQGHYVLAPHEFMLAVTAEYIELPAGIRGRVEGKSSLARLGLLVHITGGFIDPGFKGYLTLEVCNVNHRPIRLCPGDPICQVEFSRLDKPARRPYGSDGLNSKYQGQPAEPVASRYVDNWPIAAAVVR